ncbi:unnamed protein product [Protopolystoma xenopodis]|uniref:Uncharacterized protein n=1 Tax=Protopolystoma xenopodis TaxID=117903 RepID=A0A3S5CS34_9PLAT|nr:unnamed protein product [Protopolystoma xenopodis]
MESSELLRVPGAPEPLPPRRAAQEGRASALYTTVGLCHIQSIFSLGCIGLGPIWHCYASAVVYLGAGVDVGDTRGNCYANHLVAHAVLPTHSMKGDGDKSKVRAALARR